MTSRNGKYKRDELGIQQDSYDISIKDLSSFKEDTSRQQMGSRLNQQLAHDITTQRSTASNNQQTLTADLNTSTAGADQATAVAPNYQPTVKPAWRAERNKTPTIWTDIGRGTREKVNRNYKNVSAALGDYIGKLDELAQNSQYRYFSQTYTDI